MHIRQIQEQAKSLRQAQGWQDRSLENRLMYLMSEVGEIAREAIRLSAVQSDPASPEFAAIQNALGQEIYDVVWNLCDLANIAGIDLEAAFDNKHSINQNRKW